MQKCSLCGGRVINGRCEECGMPIPPEHTYTLRGESAHYHRVNGEDVLHHKITGSWTGPVVLGGSDTPVADSGKHFDEEDSASSGAIDGGSTTQRELRKKPIENLREYVTKPVESQPFKRAEFR